MLFAFLPAALGRVLFLALHLSPSRFPQPLSPRQEAAVFAAMAHGDAAARDRLIRHNLRLVAHIAKKYYAADTPEDLISTGSIGLIKAVNTFDPARGIKFSTYASRCIENAILSQQNKWRLRLTARLLCIITVLSDASRRRPSAPVSALWNRAASGWISAPARTGTSPAPVQAPAASALISGKSEILSWLPSFPERFLLQSMRESLA